MVASSTKSRIVDQRGDQNIPKWYLKSTRWNLEDDISELPLGPGCYIINPDEGKDDWIPVDFDFNALWWGLMYQWKSDGKFEIYQPAPSKYGLWIYGEERIWDRSQWGPIDGTTDTEEGINFQFRSDVDNTPEPEPEDISVPTIDQVERLESTIADLAGLLSSFVMDLMGQKILDVSRFCGFNVVSEFSGSEWMRVQQPSRDRCRGGNKGALWLCKVKTKSRLRSNYSYYRILIVEDAQLIVNKTLQ